MAADNSRTRSVAIVGAGLAGLTAAAQLTNSGIPVAIFDKGHRPGGRMSTRRTSGHHFDHGAQYFTARDDRFRSVVDAWSRRGFVRAWDATVADVESGRAARPIRAARRYIGAPGMDRIIASLASNHDVKFSTQIAPLERRGKRWVVSSRDGDELGRYDVVVVAVPADQAGTIIGVDASFAAALQATEMSPCWAVMAVFGRAIDVPLDAAFVRSSPLAWACRNNSKPGRPLHEAWVLHASADWSRAQIDRAPNRVCEELLGAFSRVFDLSIPDPEFVQAHRWRYAKTEKAAGVGSLWDPAIRLGACGDWCLGNRVEAAFLSGADMASRVLGRTG